MAAESPASLAVWAVSGLLLAAGTGLSGQAHATSLAFFDWTASGAYGPFQLGLAVTFAAGLAVSAAYYQLARPARPVLAPRFDLPTATAIDAKLVGGSALFGVGWAMGGYCPTPPMSAMVTGDPHYVVFAVGLLAGLALHNLVARAPPAAGGGAWTDYALSGAVAALPLVASYLGPTYFPVRTLRAAEALQVWPLPWSAAGGALIGLGAATLLHFNGRILGACGIFARLLRPTPVRARAGELAFTVGILLGGVLLARYFSVALSYPPYPDRSLGWIALGGFLEGVGTASANGCTSGHGICGLARFSKRSAVAVGAFMAAAFVCVPIFQRLLG